MKENKKKIQIFYLNKDDNKKKMKGSNVNACRNK